MREGFAFRQGRYCWYAGRVSKGGDHNNSNNNNEVTVTVIEKGEKAKSDSLEWSSLKIKMTQFWMDGCQTSYILRSIASILRIPSPVSDEFFVVSSRRSIQTTEKQLLTVITVTVTACVCSQNSLTVASCWYGLAYPCRHFTGLRTAYIIHHTTTTTTTTIRTNANSLCLFLLQQHFFNYWIGKR